MDQVDGFRDEREQYSPFQTGRAMATDGVPVGQQVLVSFFRVGCHCQKSLDVDLD